MNKYKEWDTGLSFLRLWMCLEVVIHHLAQAQVTNLATIFPVFVPLDKYRLIAVPVFMLMSFMLFDMSAIENEPGKIFKRLKRLTTPIIFWVITYYVVYTFISFFREISNFHGISDLFWQLLFGHSYNLTLWFQFDLIVLTIIFYIIYQIMPLELRSTVVTITVIIAIYLQNSGINGHMFDGLIWPDTIFGVYFNKSYVVNPIGRILEMLPFAAVGLLFDYNSLKTILQKHRRKAVVICIFILATLFSVQIFTEPDGFAYAGLYYLCAAFTTVILFLALPFERLPQGAKKVINSTSQYTMGVYFMHEMIIFMFDSTISSINLHTILGGY